MAGRRESWSLTAGKEGAMVSEKTGESEIWKSQALNEQKYEYIVRQLFQTTLYLHMHVHLNQNET